MQTIERAVFQAEGHEPEDVALPDAWSRRGVPGVTQGRYRMRFDASATPGEPMAMFFERVSSDRRILLNGVLIHVEALGPPGSNPGRPVAALIDLPSALMTAQANELVVEVRHRFRGGLSAVEIGPKTALRDRFDTHVRLAVWLPQALNMASAGVASLLLLLWWRRRSEVAIGAFGALSLLWSLRDYTYYLDAAFGEAVVGSWLTFTANLWGIAFFFVFAQAVAQRRWPRATVGVFAAAVVLTLVGYVAVQTGYDRALRMALYPPMLVPAGVSLALVVHAAWRGSGTATKPQAIALALLFAASLNDFVVVTRDASWLTASYVAPFVLPLVVVAVSITLVKRIVGALGRVEGLNVELEARVAQRTRELEAANTAKTRFLAAASHDLRQPLVSIGLMVGLAREQAHLPAQRTLLDKADESVGAMESLLSGLLDLSRLEGGTVHVRVQAVALRDIWAAIDAHEASSALRKGLRLRFRETSLVVQSDPVLLERAIRNLVVNAIRYTSRGGVLVAARRRGARVRIEVRDSGIGISPEDHARVFDEFVQLPVADRAGGLGLGLTIVKRSLDLLGHTIDLRSHPGLGSCFAITVDPAPRAPARTQPPAAAPASAKALAGRRIVLVEDDATVREALRSRLTAWGGEVHALDSVATLQRWLAGEHPAPDLAVCDFQLADGNGIDVIALLHQRHGPALRAVLITGDTAPRDLSRLDRAHAPVLHKPFRAEALLALLVRDAAQAPLDSSLIGGTTSS